MIVSSHYNLCWSFAGFTFLPSTVLFCFVFMSRVLFETLLSVNWFVQTTVNIPAACFYFAFMFFFSSYLRCKNISFRLQSFKLRKRVVILSNNGYFGTVQMAENCHCLLPPHTLRRMAAEKKITKTGKKRRNMGGSAKKKEGGNVNVFRFCE